jgi:hypothetical protein
MRKSRALLPIFTASALTTLGWGSVARADAPPPAVSAAPLAPAAPAAATAEMVFVHIDSPSPVDLQFVGSNGDSTYVCTSPCDKVVPADRDYDIGGNGVRASRMFRLEKGGRIKLDVSPATPGAHTAGVVITVIGIVGLVPGAAVTALVVGGAILGAIFICPFAEALSKGSYVPCLGDVTGLFAQGYTLPFVWVPAAIGGGVVLTGIAVLLSTGPTTVNQTATPAPAAPAATQGSWRAPQWREARDSGVPPLPPAAVVPLVSLTF